MCILFGFVYSMFMEIVVEMPKVVEPFIHMIHMIHMIHLIHMVHMIFSGRLSPQ